MRDNKTKRFLKTFSNPKKPFQEFGEQVEIFQITKMNLKKMLSKIEMLECKNTED